VIGAALLLGVLATVLERRELEVLVTALGLGTVVFMAAPLGALAFMDWLDARGRGPAT
jgi:hypothetical protein